MLVFKWKVGYIWPSPRCTCQLLKFVIAFFYVDVTINELGPNKRWWRWTFSLPSTAIFISSVTIKTAPV